VFEIFQGRTARLFQSMIATRYAKPWHIGMQVMQVHQAWFGLVTTRSRNRSG